MRSWSNPRYQNETNKRLLYSTTPLKRLYQILPSNPLPFHRTRSPHHPPPEELTHNTKPVFRPSQFRLEQIMLIRRFNLPLADSSQRSICRCADGALGILVDAVETALVEGVAAEEVDGG